MSAPAAPAVVVLAHDADAVARCLKSLATTDPPAELMIMAGGSSAGGDAIRALGGSFQVTWLDAAGPAAINVAAEAAVSADLVILDDRTAVGEHWLEDLSAVAAVEPDAATISPVTNDGAFLSVPRRNLPWPLLPGGLTLFQAADRVRAGALRLHPRTPTALPHMVLVRRQALQLVGPLDESLPTREALADFCMRCTAAGLVHVVADEIFVAHRGSETGEPARAWSGAASERHPALAVAVEEAADARHSALACALLAVSVALEPLSVTIDARSLAGNVTGTTMHLVELLGALVARDDVRVRALLPRDPGEEAARALDGMTDLERLPVDLVADRHDIARTHVAHRPWQVESVADLDLLDQLGERTVLTQQDLIGYRTPGVFASPAAWQDYRRVTADALGLASMVLFFSRAAAADAAADDLVSDDRVRVIPLGAAGRHLTPRVAQRVPEQLRDLEHPFLLVLGNRFRHKNVRFALELLAALRDDHGWDGKLVIAGAEVLHGSSSGDEAAWHLAHPANAVHVVETGAVAEAEKAWLLAHAAGVVYPSTYEGFGLIPFEAAAVGTPCLMASVSALRDLVPKELALLTPWDPARSAERVAAVLTDGPRRDALVEGLRHAAGRFSWESTAEAVVSAYRDAVRLPAPAAARLGADLARAEHDYWSVRDGIPDEVWPLVRPEAPLVDPPLGRDLAALLGAAGGRTRLLRALKIARRLPTRR